MTDSFDQRGVSKSLLFGGGVVMVAIVVAIFWFGYAAIKRQPDGPVLMADPDNAEQVALGGGLYREHCADCHGADLKGEEGWRTPPADGPRPAPPHDESGHTWHHGDGQLFELTKYGPGKLLDMPDYDGGMPGFEDSLSDDQIWAVLAFIKSHWPEQLRARQAAVTLGEQSVGRTPGDGAAHEHDAGDDDAHADSHDDAHDDAHEDGQDEAHEDSHEDSAAAPPAPMHDADAMQHNDDHSDDDHSHD